MIHVGHECTGWWCAFPYSWFAGSRDGAGGHGVNTNTMPSMNAQHPNAIAARTMTTAANTNAHAAIFVLRVTGGSVIFLHILEENGDGGVTDTGGTRGDDVLAFVEQVQGGEQCLRPQL